MNGNLMQKTEEILKIIKARRNTKNFIDKEINDSQIETILDSAIWAPNHRNTEPWRFFIIERHSKIREKIAEGIIDLQENTSQSQLNKSQKDKILEQIISSPSLIFVYSLVDSNDEITEENYGAVCCAIQNMQLTATTMGLGVGWSTGKITKINSLDQILGIKESLKIVGVLTIGYPHTSLEKTRKSFKSLSTWL